jgi:dTDP-4-amino-4,6-dideoxygalactose transaminase
MKKPRLSAPAASSEPVGPGAPLPSAARGVPFQDLYPANAVVEKEFLEGAARLFRESAFSGGPYVASFEKAFADHLGAKHCLGLDSGASAVHLVLAALGIGPGDEVILPAYAFADSAWGILRRGAVPVFADVDPDTACIDANALAQAISPRTKAVVVAHLFGRPADMDLIREVLRAAGKRLRRRIALIEDCAHAHGARWDGEAIGTLGDAGCFSFHPGGNLGAAGEGGAVTTDDSALAGKMSRLRGHGPRAGYGRENHPGFNCRMDGLQGLFLEKKLAHLDRMNAERASLAQLYLECLYTAEAVPLGGGEHSVWHRFVCRVKRREAFLEHLDRHGIGYGIRYPLALPETPHFRARTGSRQGSMSAPAKRLPHALALSRSVVSLPLFIGMTPEQVERVADVVNAFGA